MRYNYNQNQQVMYPPAQDPLYGYFQQVAGQDGQIDSVELQRCLTSAGMAGYYQHFSLETCRLMILMLDRDYSGNMGFEEFKELWNALNNWKGTFATYDRDRSGTVEHRELQEAITTWGYKLSSSSLKTIVKRYSDHGCIKFDDFVSCAIRLRLLTENFRRRDTAQSGRAQFGYDEFIKVTMFS